MVFKTIIIIFQYKTLRILIFYAKVIGLFYDFKSKKVHLN